MREFDAGAGRDPERVQPMSDLGAPAASGGSAREQASLAAFEPHFGHDFSGVRIHHDARAAAGAVALNARAYTVGRDVYFGPGEYAPQTANGQHLLAHELTHVVQQGAAERQPAAAGRADTRHFFGVAERGRVQRAIDEKDLKSTPVERIMGDATYFERGIERIEYYTAEVAILHYDDGTSIRLGLVPGEIDPPFEGVDYKTSRSSHIPVSPEAGSLGRGSITFLPRGNEMELPPDLTFADLPKVTEAVGRTIRFTHHPSGHIVPTEVNDLSAPHLSAVLREAEAEYVRAVDEGAEAAIKVLEKMGIIIEMQMMMGGGGAGGGAGGAAGSGAAKGAAARGVFSRIGAAVAKRRARKRLAKWFATLLRSGKASSIVVEGVEFAGVQVAKLGGELVVSRSIVFKVAGKRGWARVIHEAFEQAAIQVAKKQGAKVARVMITQVDNPGWKIFLGSRGYVHSVAKVTEKVTSGGLTKVFPL